MQRRKFIQIIAEYIRYIELNKLMQANIIEIAFSTAIIFDVRPNGTKQFDRFESKMLFKRQNGNHLF